VKEKLQKLKTDARALEKEIRGGATDDQIKERMIKLHDLFHEIMESWMDKGESHDDVEEEDDDH